MPVQLHPTSYGRAAHEVLHGLVGTLKDADPLAPVTLLVPTNQCGTFVRRSLASLKSGSGAEGVAALNVLTVDRLAELVAAPMLVAQGRRPATGPVVSAAWRHALSQEPGLFAQVARHPATVQALVAAHRQLRELSPQAVAAVADSGRLTADVVRLHQRVVHALGTAYHDSADLREAAAKHLMASPQLEALGTVVLFMPQDLARTGAELIGALAQRVDLHVVAGLTGHAQADSGVLTAVGRATGMTLPPISVTEPIATHVVHASDADDEVRTVVRELVEALRTTRAARVAVLYGTAVPYARLLHDHLSAAHIQTHGPGVRPTAERALPRSLLTLLTLAQDGVDRAGLFRLLSGAGVLLSDGSFAPTARWERLSRRAGVVGPLDWRPRLERYAAEQRGRADTERSAEAPRQGLVDRFERDAQAADDLLRFVVELQRRLDEGQRAVGWSALSSWALELSQTLLGDEQASSRLPEEERRAAEKLAQVLAGLAGLETVEPGADLTALREVVELELADDLPRSGQSGSGVLVAPLSAALGLDAEVVFVVGLAEGLTPTRLREDALLPDRARAATDGELPAVRDRLDRQHRHLLAALSAAPRVVASFPRGDLRRSGERLPSRWLLPTLRALADKPDLDATTWQEKAGAALAGSRSYAASVSNTDAPATEQEWRLRSLAAGVPLAGDGVLDGAQALLQARHSAAFTRYDGNLGQRPRELPDPSDGVRTVSPTALEHWASCPHAYLLQRVLGVEPVEQPEELVQISPADRGSLLHDAMDRFFRDLSAPPTPDQPWTAQQRARLRELGEQVADEFEQRGVTGHPTLWARDRALVLLDLDLLLTRDGEVRRTQRRRQVRSELSFGRKGVAAVEVPLPDGRTVRLAGSADRVDECEDGSLVVVDYKAGKPDSFKGLSEEDPDKQASKLQLPVYGYAARQALDSPDAPVRMEYWFIGPRGRGTQIGYVLTDDVAKRYAEVLAIIADGIAGGVFPANVPEDRPWSSFVACPYCDPDGLGAKERRVQWQRKKTAPELREYLALTEPDEEQQ